MSSCACSASRRQNNWRTSTTNFADIKKGGEFVASGPLPVERDEPTLKDLHRLVFAFNRKDHGRLRMLIDYLNGLPE